MVSIFCFVIHFDLITPLGICLQLKINIFYKFSVSFQLHTWRRHQMEQFPCHWPFVWGTPVTGEFPSQRPVIRVFDVLFDLRLNKRLSKQSRRRWFATPSLSLWPHCNDWQIVNLKFHTMFCLWWRGRPHPYARSGDRTIKGWELFIRPILTWRLGAKDSATTGVVCWKNSKHRSKSLYFVHLYISIYKILYIFEYAQRNSMCFIKCINYEFLRRTAYPCVTRAM